MSDGCTEALWFEKVEAGNVWLVEESGMEHGT